MIIKEIYYLNLFGIAVGILYFIFVSTLLSNSFSLSDKDKFRFSSILFEDFFPLIMVEYESDSLVVLKGDEDSLLILNGTLAPMWNSIDIVKGHGYQLKEVTESGMGSKGNPTRFYAILEK